MSSENNISNNETNEENIYIKELTEEISLIIKSPNKNDFIKKYNKCHECIKKVDSILYAPNTLDNNIDIKTLFEMLKEYDVLLDKDNIDIKDYKKICDLIELIENKMKTSTIDIKEIQ